METEALYEKLDNIHKKMDVLVKNYQLSLQKGAALKDEIKVLRSQLHTMQRRNQKAGDQVKKLIARIKEEMYD